MSTLIRFIRDVSRHEMSVIRDDGLYRHLRFQRPGSSAYYFDLVTWPGYLAVTGDMGTWTFSRVTDMFDFFTDKHFGTRESFLINPGYWSEKFQSGAAGSRRDGPCYEFDPDDFDKRLQLWLDNYLEDCTDEDDRESVSDNIRQLKGNDFRTDSEAYYEVKDCFWPNSVDTYDLMENIGSCQRHPFHYLWACYAIVWGIERYRNNKLANHAVDTFLAFQSVRDLLHSKKEKSHA